MRGGGCGKRLAEIDGQRVIDHKLEQQVHILQGVRSKPLPTLTLSP